MALPSQFIRVEWRVARFYDRPHDRVERSRNFASETAAARQVHAVLAWVPSHAELIGVWRSTAVWWTPIDPAELPPPPTDDELPD